MGCKHSSVLNETLICRRKIKDKLAAILLRKIGGDSQATFLIKPSPRQESLAKKNRRNGQDEMMLLVRSNTAKKPLKESVTTNSDGNSAPPIPNCQSDMIEGEFETINAWELMEGLLEDENELKNGDSSFFISAAEAKLPFQSELQLAQQIPSSPSSSKTEMCFSYGEGFCWLHNVSFGRYSHSRRFRSFPSVKDCIVAGSLGTIGSKADSEKAILHLPCSLTKEISVKEDCLADSVSTIRSKAESEKAIDSIPRSSKKRISTSQYRINESLDTARRKAESEKEIYSLRDSSKKAILATEDCLTASVSTIRSKSNSEKVILRLPRSSMKAISVPEDYLTDSDSLIRSKSDSEKRIVSLPPSSNETISVPEDRITDSVSMLRSKNNSEKRINSLPVNSTKGISVEEDCHTYSDSMIRSEFYSEKRINSLSPSSNKAILVPEDRIADSVSNIKSKGNSEKVICSVNRSFAERTLSFKFLLDGSNSGEASFDEEASSSPSTSSEIILKTADCPSCPPSPDFFTTARNPSPLRPSAPSKFSISEEPRGKFPTEDSQPNSVNHNEKGGTHILLGDDVDSQSDSNASEPFFDPELLDSLEKAIAQLTEEEWNAMAKIDEQQSSFILGYSKEQDSGTKCWF